MLWGGGDQHLGDQIVPRKTCISALTAYANGRAIKALGFGKCLLCFLTLLPRTARAIPTIVNYPCPLTPAPDRMQMSQRGAVSKILNFIPALTVLSEDSDALRPLPPRSHFFVECNIFTM